MTTGLLGTENDQEATALVALVMMHGLVSRSDSNTFEGMLAIRAFRLAREFLQQAKAPEL
jgi:predicted proteasome-type protease